ncbi:LysM peptidoglycan-binding domain-containing protein [Nocardioides KLBMP 9356]|uniref:LysM peptidoglycan-binding domain-containing protein n=1 Tax=Nocardioides potassii TaxID=2911371 RepID=A0ABS9HFA4_9ACTN|nr:LysM domain-containing protein [Nocardioides potassii]MCF6379796.1 LysM peptidoglycan-binding domain-containing protein [Nocardioides potassii]
MSRVPAPLFRPLAVWLAVSGAAVLAVATVPGAWAATRSAAAVDGVAEVDEVVVAACATALALALGWLWLVTTATVVDLLRGRVSAGGATRRLVLVACGVAVVAGTSVPAMAAGGDGSELLAGLPLPERAAAPARHRTSPRPPPQQAASPATGATYVVRPGDSLSSIALAHPGTGSLDERWRLIWRANRDVVGDDPDLILPGQVLRLPGPTHTSIDQDGDRP